MATRTRPLATELAIVTCYRHPDYIRAITLRQAARDAGFAVIVVKNSRRGAGRYLEVVRQLWRMRARRPDAYLVTFRGYEILPFVLALAGGRPVYYDEFINPVEWFVDEHRKLAARSIGARLLRGTFRRLMRRTAGIITDTSSHADYSAARMGIDRDRYSVIPVGTDEATFAPLTPSTPTGQFRVLLYGSMLPLHGLDVVLDALERLRPDEGATLVAVGGDETTRRAIESARARGTTVDYREWVEYERLPELFAECDLMLGGPFGDTVQSRFVITGKTYQFLACGLPTVVGINEESGIFTDRVDALLVPQGDPAALADAIRWSMRHRERLAEIGRAARTLYDAKFAAARIAESLTTALGAIPRT